MFCRYSTRYSNIENIDALRPKAATAPPVNVGNLRIARAWADQGWPAELDESGSGITAPFNAPSQGSPPWNVYRIEPRSAIVVSSTEPGGLTRFGF
jgi:hypothetical protein